MRWTCAVLLAACSSPDRAPAATAASPAGVMRPDASAGAGPAAPGDASVDAPGAAADDAAVAVAPAPAAEVEPPYVFTVLQRFRGIDLVESVNSARHVHGGRAAWIGDASINFEVRDGRAHTIAITAITMLRASCNEKSWRDRTPLKITGHEAYDWISVDPIASGETNVMVPANPPQRYGIKVLFVPVHAYQACDRFGFAIEGAVDKKRFKIELPLRVMRFEPLRDPP